MRNARLIFAIAALALLGTGCAMERVMESDTYLSGVLQTHQKLDVIGLPSLVGESHDMQAAPGLAQSADISKAQLAGVALAGIGAFAGIPIGPVGPLLGGTAGAAAGHYMDGTTATPTTSTASILAPVMVGKMSMAAPQQSAAVAPDALQQTLASNSEFTVAAALLNILQQGAISGTKPTGLGAAAPTYGAMLKSFLAKHPGYSRLQTKFGPDVTNSLIDDVFGVAPQVPATGAKQ